MSKIIESNLEYLIETNNGNTYSIYGFKWDTTCYKIKVYKLLKDGRKIIVHELQTQEFSLEEEMRGEVERMTTYFERYLQEEK